MQSHKCVHMCALSVDSVDLIMVIVSSEASEAEDLSPILGALCINLGTLTDPQIEGMHAAGKAANRNGKPVVFDPVGCGASALRRETTDKLLNAVQFTCIKGNAGEGELLAAQFGAKLMQDLQSPPSRVSKA